MTRFFFTIPGKPGAKGRPRFTRGGIAYTPQETVNWENLVKVCALQAGAQVMEGPLKVSIWAQWECPTSKYRKRDPRPAEWKASKPDLDNVIKGICDALNGVCWHDDAQAVHIDARKMVGCQGCTAGTIVIIETLE